MSKPVRAATAHERSPVPEEGAKSLRQLEISTKLAERWLARWMRQKSAQPEPGDGRDLNQGITSLRRLIDAHKALKELQSHEIPDFAHEDQEATEAEIMQILERIESEPDIDDIDAGSGVGADGLPD